MKNWKSIDYLLHGNKKQIKAYDAIIKSSILEILNEYNSILVGTIPIEVDIDDSDLDIICEVYDFNNFIKVLNNNFGEYENYILKNKQNDYNQIIVANFRFMGFEFEIYATSFPTETFNGYKHMLIENRILDLLGKEFREKVIALKIEGLKTEPTFAKLLGLSGDPYDELLKLKDCSNQEIIGLYETAKTLT